MIEFFLSLGGNIGNGPLLGRQAYLATNQVGQIKYSNSYGHCSNWDGSKFYTVVGSPDRNSAPSALFCEYDVDTNVWTILPAPAELSTYSYWSMMYIDEDRLFAQCRLMRYIYTISTKTWTALANGPTGDANMYGSKMHRYKGKIYNVGDAAANSVMSVGIFDPATNATTNGGNSGLRLGTYSLTVRCNNKIYGFPGIPQAHQRVQIYDLETGTFSATTANLPTLGTFAGGVAFGDLIYIFGGSLAGVGLGTVHIYNTLTDTFSAAPVMKRTNTQPGTFLNRGTTYLWGGNSTGNAVVYNDFNTYQMGIDIPQFGPGPRDIAYGDITQGFYGELPAGKFMSISDLRSLSGVTEGSNDDTWNGKWFKMSIYDKVVFVPSAQVATGITFQNLASRGVADGKEVTFQGRTYKMRLVNMADGNTWPISSDFTNLNSSVNVMNSEWGKIVGGLIAANGFTVGRKWNLYPTASTLSPTGKWIHARQLRNGNPSNSIVLDNSRYSFNAINTPSTVGWYPVLELVS